MSVCLLAGGLAACSASSSQASADLAATQVFESALLTATWSVPTATPLPTQTPTPQPTPTVVRTPPALPGVFQTSLLNKADAPRVYEQDVCAYLKNRLDPAKAQPGTVVMPIMFHSITDGPADKVYQISHETLDRLMRDLKDQGFEIISMDQLVGFLYENEWIPPRSVVLISDDLHFADYYESHFKPFFADSGGVVVNAWISKIDPNPQVIQENQRLQTEGWVDHQAHGVVHNINISALSDEAFIRSELQGSRDSILATFGKAPVAYIWPGGGFTPQAAEIALELGYKVGFTTNPRGPLMYNWIPNAQEKDANRPALIPEGEVTNPLMVLPRFWDADASRYIDMARRIGQDAALAAQESRAMEMEYYQIVCQEEYGPLSGDSE
ncbi:MAG: polysaccharide deacetylase family protein [Chloroflexi bacterium]|nr:polysaccharide deacetylase family protein [Chloroflexota bacterium]